MSTDKRVRGFPFMVALRTQRRWNELNRGCARVPMGGSDRDRGWTWGSIITPREDHGWLSIRSSAVFALSDNQGRTVVPASSPSATRVRTNNSMR